MRNNNNNRKISRWRHAHSTAATTKQKQNVEMKRDERKKIRGFYTHWFISLIFIVIIIILHGTHWALCMHPQESLYTNLFIFTNIQNDSLYMCSHCSNIPFYFERQEKFILKYFNDNFFLVKTRLKKNAPSISNNKRKKIDFFCIRAVTEYNYLFIHLYVYN